MPSLSHNSVLFNATPYYDDFDSSKNYLKMLFRPGRAVQARELTQLQTILQNQIEQFGTHVFQNGAVILGGEISESLINFARVDTSNSIGTNLDSMVGQRITDGNAVAEVYHVLSGSTLANDVNEVLFYQYTTQGTFSPGSEIETTGSGSIGVTFGIKSDDGTAPAVGDNANLITVDNGVFFVDGYFVDNTKQSVVPFNGSTGDYSFRSFSSPTSTMGWSVSRSITNADDDSTLRDPSSGFYNYNAPGSDRYKIGLSLKQMEFSASLGEASGLTFDNKDYIELVRMVGGSTTKKVRYTDYADLEETFARRTFDESGNYTVNTPGLKILEHGEVFSPSDSTKFAVAVEPNTSYVKGYEVDTQSSVFLEVDKPRVSTIKRRELQYNDFGSSVLVGHTYGFGAGIVGADSDDGFNWLTKQQKFTIFNASDAPIGTTRLRTIKRGLDDNKLRAYIYDTALSGDNKFNATSYMVMDGSTKTGNTGCWFGITADSSGFSGPFNAGNKTLIYPVENGVVGATGFHSPSENITSKFVVQKQVSVNIAAGGSAGTVESTYFPYVPTANDGQFLVVYGNTADGRVDLLESNQYDIRLDNTGETNVLTFDLQNGLTAPASGASASIILPVAYDGSQVSGSGTKPYRTLTITNVSNESITRSGQLVQEGTTWSVFDLSKAHTISHSNVKAATNGESIQLTDTKLDDGNRESLFQQGRVLVKDSALRNSGEGDGDAASINVDYSYYAHSGVGPVVVNSYLDAGVAYESVPSFNDPDSGKRYDLRNCVDYRPVRSSSATTEFGIPYWNLSSPSEVSYSYFLPRVDKVTLCGDRVYRVIKGADALNPTSPVTTPYDMDMFEIVMKPYVFNEDTDIKVRYIDNQRFTMREIGDIEDKVEENFNNQYVERLKSDAISRALSYNTSGQIIEDGIFVDDFSSHAFSDVTIRDHNCAVDTRERGLRPPYTTNSVPMVDDSPSGLSKSSDGLITYKFTSSDVFRDINSAGELIATSDIQINPYGSTDYLGHVKLEPSSDVFYDTSKNPSVLVNTFGENNAWELNVTAYQTGRAYGFGTEYNEWTNHWFGEEKESKDISSVDPNSRTYMSPVDSVSSKLPGRITETVGDSVVDKSIVPYMRSVGITFTSYGLLPGSTVYALMDNQLIGASGTGYPVDGNGGVSGHIVVPSGTFTTGIKQFRLSDSSTNTISQTNTAADANFYAKGLIDTKSDFSTSVRPPVLRRKSVKSSQILTDLYDQNQEDNFSTVVNGLEPLSQEIIVDPGVFSQGLFLDQVNLYFKQIDADLPVSLQIRPMYNGAPHPYHVIPFSEVTVKPSTTAQGPSIAGNTTFQFSSPVYLAPGRYAVCLLSNSPNNKIFKSVEGELPLTTTGNTDTNADPYTIPNGLGVKLGSLFLPLNNGSRVKKTNEILAMTVRRCKFDGNTTLDSSRTVTFSSNPGSTANGHIVNVSCNDPLFTSSDSFVTLDLLDNETSLTYSNITPNKNIELAQPTTVNSLSDLELKVKFSQTNDDSLSPVIDTERVSALVANRESSNPGSSGGAIGEISPDAGGATTVSRYVSKIVTLDNQPANWIAVMFNAKIPDGRVQVFVKTDNLEGNFDENNWTQLFFKPNDNEPETWYAPSASLGGVFYPYVFRPENADGGSQNPMEEFSRFSVKIVMQIGSSTPEADMFRINDLKVVPYRI